MSKFEESRPHHEVHEVGHPQGHGYLDQKHQKGMRSPIVSSVPSTEAGAVAGSDGSGSPGMPNGIYGSTDSTGS